MSTLWEIHDNRLTAISRYCASKLITSQNLNHTHDFNPGKWAVEGFVRSMGFLDETAGIRVVVLEPGVIKVGSPFLRTYLFSSFEHPDLILGPDRSRQEQIGRAHV